MKECYWCKKSCPDDEEGDFEVDSEDVSIKLGWVCNHCLCSYLGLCDCKVCVLSNPQMPVPSAEKLKERLRQYNEQKCLA